MKTRIMICLLALAALGVRALPVYEAFDYPANTGLLGKSNAPGSIWVAAGPAGPPIMVRTGNLEIANLALPAGNHAQLRAVVGPGARLPLGGFATNGSIYFSFMLRADTVTGLASNGTAGCIAGLDPAVLADTNPPAALAARVWLRPVAGGGYNLGMSKTSSNTQDVAWTEGDWESDSLLLIIGSYTFVGALGQDDSAQFWIFEDTAPPGLSSNPPPATLSLTNGGDVPRLGSFTLLQFPAAAAPADVSVDELRIGTDWAGVTPPGPPILDFGDAPAPPYPTLLPGGARHRVGALRLGTLLDAEANGQPVDMDGADEGPDGVVLPPFLTPGTSPSVTIVANGPAGYVDVWIDCDGVPGWSAADRLVPAAPHPGGGTSVAYPITVPAGAPIGFTWARVRLGLNPLGLPPGGYGGYGEVADYRVEIRPPAGLSVAVGSLPAELSEGTQLPLTVSASNAGPGSASSVQLGFSLPAGAILQSLTSSQGSCQVEGSNVTCSLSTLAAQQSFTVQAVLSVDSQFAEQAGIESYEWDFDFLVGAVEYDPNPTDNQVHARVVVLPNLDFGDARLGYPVTRVENGARHLNGAVFHMGLAFDREPNGMHSPTANHDDVTGAADEDGVVIPVPLLAGRTHTATVTVPVAGRLDVFFDFNNDGDWNDPGERVTPAAGLLGGPGAVPVAVAVPLGAVSGTPHARFRFSDVGGLPPTGFHPVGEVSDYQVELRRMDFGNAPDPLYPTRLASDGARHAVDPAWFLGTLVDWEADGPDPAPPDEDGVVFLAPLYPGLPASVQVTASVAGKLDAFIDFTGDGDWNDGGERITLVAGTPLFPGPNLVTFTVPASATTGSTWARFRFSDVGGLLPTGPAAKGEVEDHPAVVSSIVVFNGLLHEALAGAVVSAASNHLAVTTATGTNSGVRVHCAGTDGVALAFDNLNQLEAGGTYVLEFKAVGTIGTNTNAQVLSLLRLKGTGSNVTLYVDYSGLGATQCQAFAHDNLGALGGSRTFEAMPSVTTGHIWPCPGGTVRLVSIELVNGVIILRFECVELSGPIAVDPDKIRCQTLELHPLVEPDPINWAKVAMVEFVRNPPPGVPGLLRLTDAACRSGVLYAGQGVSTVLAFDASNYFDVIPGTQGDGGVAMLSGISELAASFGLSNNPTLDLTVAKEYAFGLVDLNRINNGILIVKERLQNLGTLQSFEASLRFRDVDLSTMEMSANMAGLGASQVLLEVYQNSNQVGTLTLANDGLCTLTGTGRITGLGTPPGGPHGFQARFDTPMLFTTGGPGLTGDELRVVPNTIHVGSGVDVIKQLGVESESRTIPWQIRDAMEGRGHFLDRGDAPAAASALDARHDWGSNLKLGTNWDREYSGNPSTNADGDDLHNSDDEDGVAFATHWIEGEWATVELTTAGDVPGFVSIWVDWNGNGTFGDTNEFVWPGTNDFVTSEWPPGTYAYTFRVPSGVVPAPSGYVDRIMRVRFSSEYLSYGKYSGYAPDGEVEDNVVRVSIDPDLDFEGLPHPVLGLATLTLASNRLHIGNLGQLGESNGVRIVLGEAEGWRGEMLVPLIPGTSPEGAGLRWSVRGLVNGSSNQLVSKGRMEIVGGEIQFIADTSALGTTSNIVQVFSNGALLASRQVANQSAVCKFVGALPNPVFINNGLLLPEAESVTCVVKWQDSHAVIVELPSGPILNANEVRLTPVDATASVRSLSEIQLTGTGMAEPVKLLSEFIRKFGLYHRALGEAHLGTTGDMAEETGKLIASNLGPSGQDGVETLTEPDGVVLHVYRNCIGGWHPFPIDWGKIVLGPVGRIGGQEIVLCSLSLASRTLRADASPMGAAGLGIEVWNSNQPVGSLTLPNGPLSMLALQGGGPLTLKGYSCSRQESGAVEVECEFDSPVTFTPISGAALTGNILRCIATGTAPVEELVSLRQKWVGYADVGIVIPVQDWGDAQLRYPVKKVEAGARHSYGTDWRLGTRWDWEANGHHSVNADYDDTHSLWPFGADDEDGVNFIGALGAITVQVTAGRNGKLDAWFDFNRDGDWNDASEKVFNNEPLTAGVNTRNIAVPSTTAAGTFVSRWRFSANGGLDPTGPGGKGEVEDYGGGLAWAPEGGAGAKSDWGDAPDDATHHYHTLQVNNGAQHTIVPGWQLGNYIDAETDGQPNANATGDDIADYPDDEDGVMFSTPLARGGTAYVEVYPSTTGALDAWVDFNRDGDWDEPNEHIFTAEPVWPGIAALDFPVPATSTLGGTYARFRFSQTGGLSPEGPAPVGEVEDYGPQHGVVIVEGQNPNLKLNLQSAAMAEDGVPFSVTATVSNQGPGPASQVRVLGQAVLAASGVITVVSNFPSQGSCTQGAEGLVWTVGSVPPQGSATLVVTLVATPEVGTNEQVQCSITAQASALEPDPEPADNQAAVQVPVWAPREWSDAPEPTYPTLGINDGPRHRRVGPYFAGSPAGATQRDADLDGMPTPNADGDDALDLNDDEEGIVLLDPLVAGATVRVQFQVGGGGKVDAWMDFDGGGWTAPGERILVSVFVPAGVSVRTFAIPASATPGPTYARFRISQAGGLSYTGFAPDGEVQDYKLQILPAAPPQEVWVPNPTSGIDLYCHIHWPTRMDTNRTYPGLVLVPGGSNPGTSFDDGNRAQSYAELGFVVMHVDPDGRGLSTAGGTYTNEDYCGFIHQDGLRAVLQYLVNLPQTDDLNLGILSSSYGITMAAGTLARYPQSPSVKFLLDWEGPADRFDTAQPHGHVPHDPLDDAWWEEREATGFIAKFLGYYLRVQTAQDHVQPDNEHAIKLVNFATHTQYGGGGRCLWTRINSESSVTTNQPNAVYTASNSPAWIPEGVPTEPLLQEYLVELSEQDPLSFVTEFKATGVTLGPQGGRITWTGGVPPFQLEKKASLNDPTWVDVGSPLESNSVSFSVTEGMAFFRIRQQPVPVSKRVTVKLPKVGVVIEQQKFYNPNTGQCVDRNRVLSGPYQDANLSNANVTRLIKDDAQIYLAQNGAIAPDFLPLVRQAIQENPNQSLKVAVWAKVDLNLLPPRPSLEFLQTLTEAQEEAYSQQFAQQITSTMAQLLEPLRNTIHSMDAQNIHVGRVAPVVFADLPAHRVVELSRMSNHVALIYNGEGTAVPTLGTSVPTIRADTVQGRGIDGSPLEVAIIEAPDDGASRVDDDLSCLAVSGVCGAGSGESSHATRVAGVVASTMSGLTGVAPGANIVSGASGDTYEQLEDLLYCTYMDSGDVFNMSLAVYYVKGCSPVPAADFIVDCFVRNYARAVIVAAGNYSLCGNHRITSPGRGWNVITVGASYDSGTSGWTDDSMWSGSCFRDPLSTHGDREKPEVVAPGQSITSLDIGSGCSATSTGTGTSLAAPHVSGTIALMLDRDHDKHCLKWWPEASKAILMASAFNNITGSTDLSDKDGAGGIDAASADLVVQGAANHGGWTARNLEADDFGSDGWLTLSSFTLTTDADRLRIALTWDAGCIPDFGSSYFEWLDADLDLFVYRGSTLVGASGSYDNNYELLEVRGANAGTYTVKVAKYRFGNPTKLGFAWAAKH